MLCWTGSKAQAGAVGRCQQRRGRCCRHRAAPPAHSAANPVFASGKCIWRCCSQALLHPGLHRAALCCTRSCRRADGNLGAHLVLRDLVSAHISTFGSDLHLEDQDQTDAFCTTMVHLPFICLGFNHDRHLGGCKRQTVREHINIHSQIQYRRLEYYNTRREKRERRRENKTGKKVPALSHCFSFSRAVSPGASPYSSGQSMAKDAETGKPTNSRCTSVVIYTYVWISVHFQHQLSVHSTDALGFSVVCCTIYRTDSKCKEHVECEVTAQWYLARKILWKVFILSGKKKGNRFSELKLFPWQFKSK